MAYCQSLKKKQLMKFIYILLISISAALTISCQCRRCDAQNTLTMLNDTIFTDQFECLNMELLKKVAKKDIKDYYSYGEKYENGMPKNRITGNESSGFTQYLSLDTANYLSIDKTYYGDGKIEYKGVWNELGFKVGKWYNFNRMGIL